MKKIIKLLLIVLSVSIIMFVWIGYQYWSITMYANDTRPQQADAIIVLGAAVWENGPSPTLKARVDYASDLYKEGFAQYIILSGGQGRFGPTEAEMMLQLLVEHGINSDILLLEDQSTNTYENIMYSQKLMEQYELKSALLVTDTFHMKRAMLLAEDQGIISYGAPVFESALYKNKPLKFYYTMREVMALTKYYLKL